MHSGLTSAEANKRRQKYGLNELRATNPNPWWKMLARQFTDLMVVILIISALIAIGMGFYSGEHDSFVDGLVILGIVVLNAGIGFFQEFKTERALEALKKLVAPHAIVIRNGQKQQIDASKIVPGDLVVLAAGDKVPADGLLIDSAELKVDEAALTGESVPVSKQIKEEVSMGTSVVSGAGLMEVTATGMETRFGRIAQLTTQTVSDQSPLQKEMFHIGIFVTKVTLVISGILILAGVLVQGRSFLDSLLFAVSVAVAAVPEGLPATITVALALGVQKMARKKAVVKRLSSIETLGSTTVICSDKTGTLTKNEMTVTRLLLEDDQMVEVHGSGYDPRTGAIAKLPKKHASSNLEKIRLISNYCTEAELQKKGSHYSILGDPTEGALLTLALKRNQSSKSIMVLPKAKVLHEVPFDSVRKMMSVVVQSQKSTELWTKGSPDAMLKRCSHILKKGKVVKLTAAHKKAIQKAYRNMAEDALRVIGFAYRPLKSKPKHDGLQRLEKGLTFVGLAGMIDPPREAVPHAVQLCHKAGIRTIIITGDYGPTAKAIAMQVGIADEHTPIILGEELDKMKDKQLDEILLEYDEATGNPAYMQQQSLIFSRVDPEHKRRIVDRLKHHGEIVAVTGDGVNDAPALKRADLGVAMGITGTEVSKETANMILLDDSFASIVTAVREGRKVYQNLKKFTWFIFSCNTGELLTVFSAIILQFPAPLTATLILAVDLGTDILPGIALGIDHAEPDVMDKPPRSQKKRIMNKSFVLHFLWVGLLVGMLVISVYWAKLTSMGWSLGDDLALHSPAHMQAATMAFAALVVIQLFNAFNARSFDYSVFKLRTLKPLWWSMVVSVAMVLAIVYVPFLQGIFRTVGLSLQDWLLVIGTGVIILMAEEIRKLLMRRSH